MRGKGAYAFHRFQIPGMNGDLLGELVVMLGKSRTGQRVAST